MGKHFYLETFGCQMNVVDSERIADMLTEIGYQQTESPEQADLVLLNTCSIRDKAERKVYGHLGRFKPLKELNRDLIVAVGGCVAQQEGERLLERFLISILSSARIMFINCLKWSAWLNRRKGGFRRRTFWIKKLACNFSLSEVTVWRLAGL